MATFPNEDGGDDHVSLRDALDAAFDQHATEGAGADAPPASSPAPAAPTPSTDAPPDGRQRDESGRFARKGDGQSLPEGQTSPTPASDGQQQGLAAPPPPGLKAPASWRPSAREKWEGLDPEVREEINRREHEGQRLMQQSAQSRQFEQAFESVVRPYEVFIRQENATPLQAVQNLMQTAADLRVGTPQHKVNIVAGIIQQYGIDLQMLDTHLAGNINSGGQQQPQQQQFRDPRVDQILQAQQSQQQAAQQQMRLSLNSEIDQFRSGHEFFDDVAQHMGDLMEVYGRRGQALTMEQAYEMACKLHGDIPKIQAQRATPAAGPSPAVLRAKRASASVKNDGQPGEGGTVPKNGSLRASIEAAFDQHDGR